MPKVLVGNGRKPALFIPIDCRLGRLHRARGARLHFNKTQDIVVPANDVDFSPPPSRAKVARHHHISQTPQMEVRILLPAPPGPLMCGNIVGWERSLGDPV